MIGRLTIEPKQDPRNHFMAVYMEGVAVFVVAFLAVFVST